MVKKRKKQNTVQGQEVNNLQIIFWALQGMDMTCQWASKHCDESIPCQHLPWTG